METFGFIERNGMSMGFSHAKFGPAKKIKIFFLDFLTKVPCHLIKKI